MIYLHATEERHQKIADTLSAMTKAQLKPDKQRKIKKAGKKATGTQRAREAE